MADPNEFKDDADIFGSDDFADPFAVDADPFAGDTAFADSVADPLSDFGSADLSFDEPTGDAGVFDLSAPESLDESPELDLGEPSDSGIAPVAPVGKKGKKEKKPKEPKPPKVKKERPPREFGEPSDSNPAWLGVCAMVGAILFGILFLSGQMSSVILLGTVGILGACAALAPFMIWMAGKKYTVYEVLLAISIIVLVIGCTFLLVELDRYGFSIQAAML